MLAKHYDGFVELQELKKGNDCPEEEQQSTVYKTLSRNGCGGKYPSTACFGPGVYPRGALWESETAQYNIINIIEVIQMVRCRGSRRGKQ